MKLSRAVKFFGTAVASLALAGFTALAVKTWAYMFMPWRTAWLVGAAVGFVPGWLLNKAITASYRKNVDKSAHEAGSVFGSLISANVLLIPLLSLGLFGPTGSLSVREATRITSEALELVEPVNVATLDTFPASEVGTGYVWVHNVGTAEKPRVVARMADGRLQAIYLDSRGNTCDAAKTEAMIGPVDEARGLVMLVPVPSEPGQTREVSAKWDGGQAYFRMRGNNRTARFTDS